MSAADLDRLSTDYRENRRRHVAERMRWHLERDPGLTEDDLQELFDLSYGELVVIKRRLGLRSREDRRRL